MSKKSKNQIVKTMSKGYDESNIFVQSMNEVMSALSKGKIRNLDNADQNVQEFAQALWSYNDQLDPEDRLSNEQLKSIAKDTIGSVHLDCALKKDPKDLARLQHEKYTRFIKAGTNMPMVVNSNNSGRKLVKMRDSKTGQIYREYVDINDIYDPDEKTNSKATNDDDDLDISDDPADLVRAIIEYIDGIFGVGISKKKLLAYKLKGKQMQTVSPDLLNDIVVMFLYNCDNPDYIDLTVKLIKTRKEFIELNKLFRNEYEIRLDIILQDLSDWIKDDDEDTRHIRLLDIIKFHVTSSEYFDGLFKLLFKSDVRTVANSMKIAMMKTSRRNIGDFYKIAKYYLNASNKIIDADEVQNKIMEAKNEFAKEMNISNPVAMLTNLVSCKNSKEEKIMFFISKFLDCLVKQCSTETEECENSCPVEYDDDLDDKWLLSDGIHRLPKWLR